MESNILEVSVGILMDKEDINKAPATITAWWSSGLWSYHHDMAVIIQVKGYHHGHGGYYPGLWYHHGHGSYYVGTCRDDTTLVKGGM